MSALHAGRKEVLTLKNLNSKFASMPTGHRHASTSHTVATASEQL